MNRLGAPHRPLRGFTLTELLTTIAIIAVLSSLSLAGLAVARQRVQADRTEMTIRKIHEVVMPHYEGFLTRTFPLVSNNSAMLPPSLRTPALQLVDLMTKRRALVIEMPDGWADLIDTGTAHPTVEPTPSPPYSAIALRLKSMIPVGQSATYRTGRYSDAECLWMAVMRGGFADPAIVGHFRDDEFGDKDGNGCREFIDAWGNPIRFLRWAPAFVSRYQPDASASHDAFDQGGRDPLASKTLFPLIFSCGADGEPDIACRDAEGEFSYAKVAFDPYFATRQPPPSGPPTRHLMIVNQSGVAFELGRYQTPQQYTVPFGTPLNPKASSDDIHNHAMSR